MPDLSPDPTPQAPAAPAVNPFANVASMADAQAAVASMSTAELDALLNGGIPPQAPPAATPTEPASQPTPPADPTPDPEKKDPPAEPTPEPTQPTDELTAADLESATPAFKKLYEDHVALLEQFAELQEKPPEDPRLKTDPILRFRLEQLNGGNAQVPLDDFEIPVDFKKIVTDSGLFEKFDKAANDDEALTILQQSLGGIMDMVRKEMALRAKANIELAETELMQAGEDRATLKYEFEKMGQRIPEWAASREPMFVDGKRNPAHPSSSFFDWVRDRASAGLLTDEQAKRFGVEWVYNTFKAEQAGGFGKHLNQMRQSVTREQLAKLKALKTGALAKIEAPTIGGQTPGAAGDKMFHGYPLDELMNNESVRSQAMNIWSKTNTKALDEFIALLSPKA